MVDAVFAHPRLAAIYDRMDEPRDDLDAYLALAEELGARSVLDVGCGTGTLACVLAERGIEVTAVDPAAASLAVARGKPGADRVRWREGEAAALPPLRVDLATMTGNVAQVFLTDAAWAGALEGISDALRPEGWLVFETRVPEREAWRDWTKEQSHRIVEVPGVGPVESWVDLTAVDPPLISFRHTYRFRADQTVLTSDSTLRFRTQDEVEATLVAAGFEVAGGRADGSDDVGGRRRWGASPTRHATRQRSTRDAGRARNPPPSAHAPGIRDAPDRPGLELVVVARRPDDA